MAVDPATITDVDALRRILANAERLKASELAAKCKQRIYELSGGSYDDPVERRLWQAVAAYEETLREKHGHGQPAAYTRRMIAKKGALQTLSDWALDPKVTPGFEALVADGSAEFTGEYIVVQFADRFRPEVVEAARQKLDALRVQVKPWTAGKA